LINYQLVRLLKV